MGVVDLYYTLYGRRRPQSVLPPELSALGRGGAWAGKREPREDMGRETKGFVIPRGEKRPPEGDSSGLIPPVKIKSEPGEEIVSVPGMGQVKIKQELDERATMGSHMGHQQNMDLPDFFQDESANMGPLGGASDSFSQFPHSKKPKKEKKKKKDKKQKSEKRERDSATSSFPFPGSSRGGGVSS